MTSRLAVIFDNKKIEVEKSKLQTSPAEMARRAASGGPRRSFLRALESSPHRPSLIAEVKAASPSQGEIRPGMDAVEVARSYERVGAECLSVLTDEKFFGGSPENLRGVRAAVPMPLLRKDFIFDEYQLDEALAWGADAVLLIVAMLDRETLADLYGKSKERGLDILVEVHNRAEAEIAQTLKPDLLGINNRNLHDFTTDLSTTTELAPLFPDALVVSESALDSAESVSRVTAEGARAVLIGTAFCKEPDIEAAVRRIMARP